MKSFIASSMIVIVSAVSQQCAHEYEFSDDPPRHSIAQISPACGRMGDTLTITGKDFSDITSKNTVLINGSRAAVLLASSTYLTAIVPVASVTVRGAPAALSSAPVPVLIVAVGWSRSAVFC